MQNLPKLFLFFTVTIPLIIDNNVFFGTAAPKTIIFLLLITISMIASVVIGFISKEWRIENLSKFLTIIKHPLVISAGLTVVITGIATIFAADTSIALWGNVERGDGFITLICLFLFFILTAVFFKKKDWIIFFKLTLLVSLIVLCKEFSQVLNGAIRPISFLSNTAFLAGYLLVSITSAGIVFFEERLKFWKIISIIITIFALLGIVFTETRGTILGLIVGGIAAVIYSFFKGKDIIIKKYSLRKISLIILVIGCCFSVLFFTTRTTSLWQSIPGFSRLANVTLSSGTAASRIMAWKSALESVHPVHQPKEFLIGWGPENVTLALGKYFNPLQYKFDSGIFDRTHNKFLDVLVMTGIFGFIAYIIFWFFIIKPYITSRAFSWIHVIMIFFWVSFLTHLLFVFDQNPTSIMFFALASFGLTLQTVAQQPLYSQRMYKITSGIVVVITLILTILVSYGYIRSYIIMRRYIDVSQLKNLSEIEQRIPSLVSSRHLAQSEVRKDFLTMMTNLYGSFSSGSDQEKVSNSLFFLALKQAETHVVQRPYDFRFLGVIANTFNKIGLAEDSQEYLKKSEQYLRNALTFTPKRQEVNYNLMINLTHQKRFDEALDLSQFVIREDQTFIDSYYYQAFILSLQSSKNYQKALDLFERVFEQKTDLFEKNKLVNIRIYGTLLKYFYAKRNFIAVETIIHRLTVHDYPAAEQFNELLEYLKKGIWPPVLFQ